MNHQLATKFALLSFFDMSTIMLDNHYQNEKLSQGLDPTFYFLQALVVLSFFTLHSGVSVLFASFSLKFLFSQDILKSTIYAAVSYIIYSYKKPPHPIILIENTSNSKKIMVKEQATQAQLIRRIHGQEIKDGIIDY